MKTLKLYKSSKIFTNAYGQAGGAPYGQPDRKNTVFLRLPLPNAKSIDHVQFEEFLPLAHFEILKVLV